MNEVVESKGETSYLASFECKDNYRADGFNHITYFNDDVLPTWIYRTNALEFTKEIFMVFGQNTTIVRYHIKNYSNDSKIMLYPLVNFRDYHGERNDFSSFEVLYMKTVPRLDLIKIIR